MLGSSIRAHVTTTFISLKLGLYTLDGPDHAGRIICHTLQIESCLHNIKPAAYCLNEQLFSGIITTRKKNSYKSMFGHVLIIGGNLGMPGAACLAALGALRVGAGLVSIATKPEHIGGLLARTPEAMIHGMETVDDLLPLLEKATVCIVGPGLGEDTWARELYSAAVSAQLPLVMDASALRMLAESPQYDDNWILTPHPSEAAGLLRCGTKEVQSDRCKAAHRIQDKYGGSVVLKGVGTIVHTVDDGSYLCTDGNPGMASAGMGDVLSGIIGGLLAQEISIANAAAVPADTLMLKKFTD